MTLTLDEIDEALHKAQEIPERERGPLWHGWVDGLLDQRRLVAVD